MAYQNFNEIKNDLNTKMTKAVDVFKKDLSGLERIIKAKKGN